MKQKGLAPIFILIGILLISVIVGGIYYLKISKTESFEERLSRQNPVLSPSISPQQNNKPTPDIPLNDETANWKTYTNTDIGYSVKYPDSIDKMHYRSTTGSSVSLSLPDINTENISEKNMEIIDATNNYKTLKEPIDNHVDQTKIDTKVVRSPYSLAGITGELLIETFPIGIEEQSMWIQYEKTILIFGVAYKPENKEKTLKYFNQILSTFKFTN